MKDTLLVTESLFDMHAKGDCALESNTQLGNLQKDFGYVVTVVLHVEDWMVEGHTSFFPMGTPELVKYGVLGMKICPGHGQSPLW